MLDSLDDITVSDRPVLPAAGTLIKGSNPTVWFVTVDGKRRGFRTAGKFFAFGFDFSQVETISDADLNIVPIDPPIDEGEDHPDGSLILCRNEGTVYQVVDGYAFPFRSANAFLKRGHGWKHVATVDCSRIRYVVGAPIDE